MADELRGRGVAILAADGVEQVDLEQPRQAVEQAGARTELLSIKPDEIQATNQDIHPADRFPVDRQVSEASADDYDALILPGGTTNPDHLRQDSTAVSFVRDFFATGKPVGVICHGSWTMEADVVRGRTLTSVPEPPDRHPQRRWQRRRPGGGHRPGPRFQSRSARFARVLRKDRRGVCRGLSRRA